MSLPDAPDNGAPGGSPPAAVTRGSARRETAGLSFVVAGTVALATPWVGYLGNLGLAPLIGGAGVLSLPVFARTRRPPPGAWCLLLLLLWAIVSYAWSPLAPAPAAMNSLKALQRVTGLKLAVEFALYGAFVVNMGRLSPTYARLAGRALALGLLAVAAVVLVDAVTQGGIYQRIRELAHQRVRADFAMRDVSRACFVLTMLFWPTVLVLERDGRRGLAIAFAVLAAADAFLFRTDAAILSLAASTVVAGLIWRFGRPGTWALTAGVVALFVATPFVVMLVPPSALADVAHASVSKASWGERLKIWTFALRLIEARPFQGWGLDASRAWPGAIPLHTHNVALQLWLELGVLGVALAALFWVMMIGRIAALADGEGDRAHAAVCGGTVAAYVANGAVGFGVWQDWWLALGAVAAGYCLLARVWPSFRAREPRALQPL